MSEFTKSTQFLVRPLGLMRKTEFFNDIGCELRRKYGFINAFIGDTQHVNGLECPIYLLFRPPLSLVFQKFLEKEYETGMLIEDYSYEGGYTVLLYEYPKEFQHDYQLVREGKYSKTSDIYKEVFPDKDPTDEPTIQHLVLHKDIRLKTYREDTLGITLSEEDELWSVFNEEEETLNIDKYKK